MQVVLDAKPVKAMFANIKPILRNSMDGGIIGFSLDKNVLTVTCKNGIIFEQRFPCDAIGPLMVTVLYRDISELLPNQGTVTLDLSEKYVHLMSESFTTTFLAAYGEVRPYTRRIAEYKPCKASMYKTLASAFSELGAVAKSLKRESSVLLMPGRAICKYPTIWLEVAHNGLTTSMSVKDLRTIANFNPKSYGYTNEAVEFVNGNSLIVFPVVPVGECKTCKDVIVNPRDPKQLAILDTLETLQSFTRAVQGPCKLTFYSDGYSVQYKSQEVEMTIRMGNCSGECYYTLDTYTEYLGMLFRLTSGRATHLYVGENAVMFEVPGELRLLHSII